LGIGPPGEKSHSSIVIAKDYYSKVRAGTYTASRRKP